MRSEPLHVEKQEGDLEKIVKEKQDKERGSGDTTNDNDGGTRTSSLNDWVIDSDASFVSQD